MYNFQFLTMLQTMFGIYIRATHYIIKKLINHRLKRKTYSILQNPILFGNIRKFSDVHCTAKIWDILSTKCILVFAEIRSIFITIFIFVSSATEINHFCGKSQWIEFRMTERKDSLTILQTKPFLGRHFLSAYNFCTNCSNKVYNRITLNSAHYVLLR